MVIALQFFLGADSNDEEQDSDDENAAPDLRKIQFVKTITKKTRSKKRQMDKALKQAKKVSTASGMCNYARLSMLTIMYH